MQLRLKHEIEEALLLAESRGKIVMELAVDKFNSVFLGNFSILQKEIKEICIQYKLTCNVRLSFDLVQVAIKREQLPEDWPKDKPVPLYFMSEPHFLIGFEKDTTYIAY